MQETVEDIDKNGDGKINLEEYIGRLLTWLFEQLLSALEAVSPKCVYYSCFTGDMYTAEDGESEPDWVQTEKKHFSEIRDTNKVKDP